MLAGVGRDVIVIGVEVGRRPGQMGARGAGTPGGARLRALREQAGKAQLWVEAEAELGTGYLQRVESGKVEAGALNFLVWDKLVQTRKVDLSKVDVFWTTPPYVDYVWTARGDLDPGLQDKIIAAFLKLDYTNPVHRRLLDLHRTKKYVKATDADWKSVEEAAISAGLIK